MSLPPFSSWIHSSGTALAVVAMAAAMAISFTRTTTTALAYLRIPKRGGGTKDNKSRKAFKGDSSGNSESTSANEVASSARETGGDQAPPRGRRETLENEMEANGGNLQVKPIGVVRSVYRLCVGTPRQGLLAPHARARIELDGVRYGVAATDGLQHFSHVWIIFVFHLNTLGKRQQFKISPPALGGAKIGVLATRSPHRFNPIGMTLAKLDKIHTVQKTVEGCKKPVATTVLEISGTDLVDGTPVLDIKPYVPTYDAPLGTCSVPEWVSEGLVAARSVEMTDAAEKELKSILKENPAALEFYGCHNESAEDTYEAISACIKEVLSMDVRSQYQTLKARKGQSQAERAQRMQGSWNRGNDDADMPALNADIATTCTQQLDNLLIHFTVNETSLTERDASVRSGAEDAVVVQSIQLIGN